MAISTLDTISTLDILCAVIGNPINSDIEVSNVWPRLPYRRLTYKPSGHDYKIYIFIGFAWLGLFCLLFALLANARYIWPRTTLSGLISNRGKCLYNHGYNGFSLHHMYNVFRHTDISARYLISDIAHAVPCRSSIDIELDDSVVEVNTWRLFIYAHGIPLSLFVTWYFIWLMSWICMYLV